MVLMYTLTSYCSECAQDFSESDSDDFEDLTQKMEARAEYLYAQHLMTGNCQ